MAKVIIYIVLALQILLVALPFVFMHIGYSKEVTQSGLHWTVILISPTIIPSLICAKKGIKSVLLYILIFVFIVLPLLVSFSALFDFIRMVLQHSN